MSRAPPPSNSAPPVSRDVVDIVKRKIAPPSNPPPAGMTINFNAPKIYKKKADRRDDRDRRDNYRDDRDDQDDDHSYDEYDNYRGRGSARDDDRGRDRDYDRRDRSYDRDDDYDRDRGRDRDYRDGNYDDEGDDYYDSQDERYDDRRRSFDDQDDYDDRNYDRNRDYDRDQDRGRDYDNRSDNRDRDYNRDRDKPRVDYHADPKDSGRGRGPGYRDVKDEQPSKPDASTSASVTQPLAVTKPQTTAAAAAATAAASSSSTAPPTTTLHNRLTIFNFQPILRSTYRELRAFVTSPCASGVTTRCYVERNRSGSKMLAPYFSLCADLEDGTGRELMVCRKVLQSRSAHYIFSLKAEDLWRKREQRSRLYLGKLRATSAHDYVLYDNGICAAPDESEDLLRELERGAAGGSGEPDALAKKVERDRKGESKGDDPSLYRRELVAIHFTSRSRPAEKGTRGMEICLPIPPANTPPAGSSAAVSSTIRPAVNNVAKPFEKIRSMNAHNQMYSKTLCVMHEKCTRYDPLSSCLVDFRGRAHMASVKNFQLVLSEPIPSFGSNPEAAHEQMLKMDADKDFILQMGKTTEDCFNMDFRHPLSLLQAFAICIARFDAKLSW